MKIIRKPMALREILHIVLIICLAVTVNNAWAAGPVPAVSVPGSATVVDNDPGSGERWGRAGGRYITYSDFILANFNWLNWQPLSASMAFDGQINVSDSEVMSGPHNCGVGCMRWTGKTNIWNDNTNAWVVVDTRLTAQLTPPAVVHPGLPPTHFYAGVDIMAAGGSFQVNLLFEANDGGGWEPALDFYDAYPTAPDADPDALTSLEQGFFYDAIIDMTVSQHDANIQARLDSIDGVLDFMKIDIINRLKLIAADVTLILGKVMWIQDEIPKLATSKQAEEIKEKIDNLQNFVICLWIGDAMFPACPPDVPPGFELPSILKLTEALAAFHADFLASQEIDVEASKVTYSRGLEAMVVLTKLNGVPTDAKITSVVALVPDPPGVIYRPVPYDATPVGPGVQMLSITVPPLIPMILVEVEYTTPEGFLLKGSSLVNWIVP
jgi:hypothetical protein